MSDDLIKRSDAIKATWQEPTYTDPLNVLTEVRDRIEAIPSADRTQEWIPCSEKMPKAEEKVWIQTERGKVCFAMYEDGTISENDSAWNWYDLPFDKWDEENDCGIIPEGWWEWTEFHPDNEFDCPVDEVVVAWMPLPKPYKEEY